MKRICEVCDTILNSYNDGQYCGLHAPLEDNGARFLKNSEPMGTETINAVNRAFAQLIRYFTECFDDSEQEYIYGVLKTLAGAVHRQSVFAGAHITIDNSIRCTLCTFSFMAQKDVDAHWRKRHKGRCLLDGIPLSEHERCECGGFIGEAHESHGGCK